MTQPQPADVVERLGYIRFLHQNGIDQARRPHPMSSAAILSFHDAVELFYVLALDHMVVQVDPRTPFEAYWRELAKVVPNLSGRRGMERLNKVRVNIKHHGSIPGTPRTPRRSSAWTTTRSRCPTWCRRSVASGHQTPPAGVAVEPSPHAEDMKVTSRMMMLLGASACAFRGGGSLLAVESRLAARESRHGREQHRMAPLISRLSYLCGNLHRVGLMGHPHPRSSPELRRSRRRFRLRWRG